MQDLPTVPLLTWSAHSRDERSQGPPTRYGRRFFYANTEPVELEIDLDECSHVCMSLYAYDVGHPLELLFSRRGFWDKGVVVNRVPGTNQFIVRIPPHNQEVWFELLPWNHRSLSLHERVPISAVRKHQQEELDIFSLATQLMALSEADEVRPGVDPLTAP